MSDEKQPSFLRVLDLKPRHDQAIKPSELIQVTGHQALSLSARRAITVLWHNAHRQGVEEGKDYTIEIDDLKPDSHKGYQIVEEAVIALMQTILTVQHSDGSIERVQFLGGNNMMAEDRPAGMLAYSFDKRLIRLLKDSTIWGKLSLPVLMAFSSKYTISIYENLAQWSGLTHKTSQRMSLEDFRSIVGVEKDKYTTDFGQLNRRIIKPAVLEINALAPFNVTILPIKTGKKVTHIRIGWWIKSEREHKDAWEELHKSKVGRKARISNQEELVLDPTPSRNRIARRGRTLDKS